MKKILMLIGLIFICNFSFTQNKWFSLYSDSTALVKDANELVRQFNVDIREIDSKLEFNLKAIKNTTPYLIFVNAGTINLPFWDEVIPQQKAFFTEVSGGENEGQKVFGLFFNGFFLVHEMGHTLTAAIGKAYSNRLDNEYDANTLAILYWRKIGQDKKLEECYNYAKQILKILKNPVPVDQDTKTYLTEHYDELSADPYKYGFIQFSQFIGIYENKDLPDFDAFVKSKMNQK